MMNLQTTNQIATPVYEQPPYRVVPAQNRQPYRYIPLAFGSGPARGNFKTHDHNECEGVLWNTIYFGQTESKRPRHTWVA